MLQVDSELYGLLLSAQNQQNCRWAEKGWWRVLVHRASRLISTSTGKEFGKTKGRNIHEKAAAEGGCRGNTCRRKLTTSRLQPPSDSLRYSSNIQNHWRLTSWKRSKCEKNGLTSSPVKAGLLLHHNCSSSDRARWFMMTKMMTLSNKTVKNCSKTIACWVLEMTWSEGSQKN